MAQTARAYTVGEINKYIRAMFDQDFLLRNIAVRAEVSNCKYHGSGHIYFSLKDESGSLACVMFAGQRRGLAFHMKDGDKVVVSGSVSVYERDGRYQLYARQITLEGAGQLYERYLLLKQELEEMGMFAQQYKQPIPRLVRRLGVVTAPTGAAIQDIRNIALRRNPFVQIILYPALVQGEGAKESIVQGIETLDRAGVDAMIVGRGGGSIEDLWAFNEECVARAIFECHTPVISAVGHETDTTIADYAADLRAPTPSAAAELAVLELREYFHTLDRYKSRMEQAVENRVYECRERLSRYRRELAYRSPESQIREKRQILVDMREKLEDRMGRRLEDSRHRLGLYIEKLQGLSPLAKLNQGFSYVEGPKGKNVTSVSHVSVGDCLHIQVADGQIGAVVQDVRAVERS